MHNHLIRLSLLLAAALSSVAAQDDPFAALGQEVGSPFTSFDIYIYPEYSHPGVGIVIEGELLPGEYPRFLEMEVPGITTIALVRMGADDETGQRVEITSRDGKSYLPVDITGPNFQVQYFYNPFGAEGGHREFDFTLATNEQLPEVHIIIQKPLHAENFTHDLNDAETVDGDFGLTFYREHIPSLAPGEVRNVHVSYDNAPGTLTITALEELMAQQRGPVRASSDPGNMTPLLLAVALMGIGLLAVVWMRKGQAKTAGVEMLAGAQQKPAGSGAALFCGHCGAPRRSDAHFCNQCGKEF